ncbi:MAG: hypothetical protein UY82_C0015G0010 [Candidatus Uhrbacteria bacterium GW2011_GWC2_53_7]|uniref:Uncharacterized protein n=1 Tax=Candidatus Uhrbacteria bacterium GW2011_GWC2_53_7 TaxID=1618986 RepID=A0A0G1Y0F1_9BACT|nr:MAG: hypothetical protein UY82_C0015G0010 [Candidatus Uhrbacteria bacterium GW2011_GWC2_53_7]
MELYTKEEKVKTIAEILERQPGAIRSRLNKLELI